MGLDITVEVQAKLKGQWVAVWDRYYDFEKRNKLYMAWLGNQGNEFGLKPISEPKGLPQDYEFDPEYGGPGDFGYSWLSAEEILNAPEQKVKRSGYVLQKDFATWDGVSEPQSDIFSDEVAGRSDMERVEYTIELKDYFSDFLGEIARLKVKYGEIRLVFGFDS